MFDEESLRSTDGATVSLSESGRTITFTTQEMTSIDETATVFFKIKNYSQYDATLGNPAISCYFVNDHAVDAKVESTSTTNPYMELIIGNQLNGVTINASGGTSVESSVTVKQTKSYVGDTQEIKFQCEINANAGDSETPGIEKPVKSIVSFNANGGNAIDTSKVVKSGEIYGDLPIPTHTNSKMIFLGWYTEDGEKNQINNYSEVERKSYTKSMLV